MKQKISEEKYNELENAIWEDFLKTASQEEIYHALIVSNWDSNDYLLNWIKENSKIDKAIILTAYWMSEPYYAKQFKDRREVLEKQSWYIDNFDFTEDIERRYCEGFYTTNKIECDPKNAEQLESYNELSDWTIIGSDLPTVREIPKIMFKKISGKKINPVDHYAYTEGLPNAYYQRIEQIFEDYEIEY